jgi:triosephosphate isomerase
MSGSMIWIGTSWKMNKTLAEARAYATRLVGVDVPRGLQPFVLPPHTALAAVRDCLPADSPVLLGAQNAHWAAEGAGTGEVSMRMVRDAGASLVEMGHSERREQFGETDATVARKARAAHDHGLTPLICVGEPADVRRSGRERDFVVAQVRAATARLTSAEVARTLVAYEPVWAIGEGGRPADPAEVSPVMATVAEELTGRTGGRGARALLYGGSVSARNAADLLRDPHTDGLFVGRAAWTAEGLLELLAIGAAHLQQPPAGQPVS